ncbi:hypothetical protein BJ166DRAFT_181857 [Pestalotiopsis sp. NC0098]|nr:hypothetical protein BJ166DRAFT_181857 [Pestalotiopsis sp. NC0098]
MGCIWIQSWARLRMLVSTCAWSLRSLLSSEIPVCPSQGPIAFEVVSKSIVSAHAHKPKMSRVVRTKRLLTRDAWDVLGPASHLARWAEGVGSRLAVLRVDGQIHCGVLRANHTYSASISVVDVVSKPSLVYGRPAARRRWTTRTKQAYDMYMGEVKMRTFTNKVSPGNALAYILIPSQVSVCHEGLVQSRSEVVKALWVVPPQMK